MKLESFLNPDSLAALAKAKENPAPPPRPPRVLVPLELPDVPPKFGEDCPACGYVLYLRVILWPPGYRPKGAPGEAWWCGRCERNYVYQEKRDGGEKGGAYSPLPQMQRPNNGNNDVPAVRKGGVPGAVQQGGEKRAV